MSQKPFAIFDLDGTLLNTASSICDTLITTLEEMNLPILGRAQIEETIGLPLESILAPLQLSPELQGIVVKRFRELLRLSIKKNIDVYPFAWEFVKKLEEEAFRLGIATSKPTLLAKESISHSTLNQFNFLVLGSDGLKPKPDPEVIHKIISLQADVSSAVMFGDRQEDMKAACAAGIQSVGIAQGAHSEVHLRNAGAKLVYQNFSEAITDFEKILELFFPKRHVP